MSLDYDLLRTIHRLLRQQTDLNERIDRGPRKIRIASETEKKLETELAEAKNLLTSTKMAADQKQLQLSEREAKIENLKTKLNVCNSNREYQLLKDQIAADEQANAVLSDEILEQLEKIDQLTIDYDAAKANLEKGVTETKRIKDRIEAEIAKLKSELERVTANRADAEKRFPGDIKAEYTRLVNANGESALASTDKETCGNCSRHLTPQLTNQLLLKEAVFCQGCGSLMYVEESTTARS